MFSHGITHVDSDGNRFDKLAEPKQYESIKFNNINDLYNHGKKLLIDITSRMNLSHIFIDQIFDKLDKLSLFEEKCIKLNQFLIQFKQLRDAPRKHAYGYFWFHKNDYETDLTIVFKDQFNIMIKNYDKNDIGYDSSIKLKNTILEDKYQPSFKSFKTEYKRINYKYNNFSLEWKKGNALYFSSKFLTNKINNQLYKSILPLIKNIKDYTFPNNERKNIVNAINIAKNNGNSKVSNQYR